MLGSEVFVETRARRSFLAVLVGCWGVSACTGIVVQPGESDPAQRPPQVTDQSSASALHRLSRREYENTLTEVFGPTASGLAERHLPVDVAEPYDTDMAYKSPSEVFVTGMEALAFDLAADVSADPALVQSLCDCSPSGATDEASLRALVDRLGRTLFRRPLSDEEAATLTSNALSFATEEADFYVGARLVVQSLVQSPEFVYRTEIGAADEEGQRLSSYELVARLSYLIWGTTPDADLLDTARDDPDLSSEELTALAETMLADRRADAQIREFHDLWLGYRNLRVSADLAPSMMQETEALLDRVLIEDRSAWTEIFTSERTYVDPTLATHYGMTAAPSAADWVTYENPARAGYLSHGSFLSLSSRGEDTSPTLRGKLVATRLLCWAIPDPPDDVDANTPPAGDEGACKSEAYAMHRDTSSTCFTCHRLMDPIGFGLERFDGYGRYRTNEYEVTSCEVSGDGEVDGVGVFNGPRELADLLVSEGLLTACGVEQFLHFSTGRAQTERDSTLIARLDARFVESGEDFRALILAFVGDPVFLYRIEETP